MKPTAIMIALLLALVSLQCHATWDEASSRGIFPFWLSDGDWYTLLVFVNGNEETQDLLYVRFYTSDGHCCSDTSAAWGFRLREQLLFSTKPGLDATYLEPTAEFGYVKFRLQDGAYVQAYELICNKVMMTAVPVPAYDQEDGF